MYDAGPRRGAQAKGHGLYTNCFFYKITCIPPSMTHGQYKQIISGKLVYPFSKLRQKINSLWILITIIYWQLTKTIHIQASYGFHSCQN